MMPFLVKFPPARALCAALCCAAALAARAQDPAVTPVPAPPAEAAPPPAAAPARLALQDDVSRHMIAIEALVVEVNEDHTRDLGLNYGVNNTRGATGNAVPGPNVFDGADSRLGRALTPVQVPVLLKGADGLTNIGFVQRLPGLGINLTGMNIGSDVVSARLRALLDSGDAAIRTRPIAVALNKTPVLIQAINEIPYLDYEVEKTIGIQRVDVIYEKVGIIMQTTPEIVSLRPSVATLDISQIEVSSVSNFMTTQNVERPVFNKSSTHTKITLSEGETFVIGGLKTRRAVHMEDRVPILGSIPLLGLLFRSQSDVERNMDVLFFVTPYVLRPGENFLLPFDFKNNKALGLDVEVTQSK